MEGETLSRKRQGKSAYRGAARQMREGQKYFKNKAAIGQRALLHSQWTLRDGRRCNGKRLLAQGEYLHNQTQELPKTVAAAYSNSRYSSRAISS